MEMIHKTLVSCHYVSYQTRNQVAKDTACVARKTRVKRRMSAPQFIKRRFTGQSTGFLARIGSTASSGVFVFVLHFFFRKLLWCCKHNATPNQPHLKWKLLHMQNVQALDGCCCRSFIMSFCCCWPFTRSRFQVSRGVVEPNVAVSS